MRDKAHKKRNEQNEKKNGYSFLSVFRFFGFSVMHVFQYYNFRTVGVKSQSLIFFLSAFFLLFSSSSVYAFLYWIYGFCLSDLLLYRLSFFFWFSCPPLFISIFLVSAHLLSFTLNLSYGTHKNAHQPSYTNNKSNKWAKKDHLKENQIEYRIYG